MTFKEFQRSAGSKLTARLLTLAVDTVDEMIEKDDVTTIDREAAKDIIMDNLYEALATDYGIDACEGDFLVEALTGREMTDCADFLADQVEHELDNRRADSGRHPSLTAAQRNR